MTTTTATAGNGPSGPRASGVRRIGALVIDTVLTAVPVSLLAAGLPAAIGALLSAGVSFAYFTYLESRRAGQTVGKRLLGIRVIAFDDGGPLDLRRAALRSAMRYVSGVGLGIGLLAALFDPEKQGWHDVAAQTVVVPVSDYPVR